MNKGKPVRKKLYGFLGFAACVGIVAYIGFGDPDPMFAYGGIAGGCAVWWTFTFCEANPNLLRGDDDATE